MPAAAPASMSRLLAVCIGRAAPLVVTERGSPETVVSGIVKTALGSPQAPVAVRIGILGLEGDEQVDHLVHGGPDKAVYVYPVEHYAFWETVRRQAGAAPLAAAPAPRPSPSPDGRAASSDAAPAPDAVTPASGAAVATPDPVTRTCLPPGAMGENLLVEGLLETEVWIGDRLRIGEVELRVESPRQPCYKFNARMGFKWATKMMVQSGYTGFYCSVLRQGSLAAGDGISLAPGPRVLTVAQTHRLKRR